MTSTGPRWARTAITKRSVAWAALAVQLLGALGGANGAAAQEPRERGARPGPAAVAGTVIDRVDWDAANQAVRVGFSSRGTPRYEIRVVAADPARSLPDRAYLDVRPARLAPAVSRDLPVGSGLVQRVRIGQYDPQTVRVVVDLSEPGALLAREVGRPPRLLLRATTAPGAGSPAPGAAASAGGGPASGAPTNSASDSTRGESENEALAAARLAAEGAVRSPTATSIRPTPRPSATRVARTATPLPPAPSATAVATAVVSPIARATLAATRAPAPTPVSSPTALPTVLPAAASPPRPTPATRHFTVVLDPGHGGKDPGARGVTGEEEKTVTLAIAEKVAALLRQDPAIQVVLTRDDDSFVSLEQRTAIANARGADVFVSIHANASENPKLFGIETYTLNNTNDRATIRLASLENGLTLAGASPGERDLAYILSDLLQTGKEEESVALARAVHGETTGRLRRKWKEIDSLGVKKGPFYVLVGAYMPCVLLEAGFLTHPKEGQRLVDPRYQDDVAAGIARGIRRFLSASAATPNL